jgi:hypothetical protein
MQIEHGYWRWKIFRWDRHPNPFRGRSDLALNWLRGFENDRRVMSELRQLLADARSNALQRATDRQVLEDVALRLSSGEFQVCAESSHPFHHDVTEIKIAAPVSDQELDAIVQPPAAAAPAPPPPAPVPAEATLPENADADRIADALKEAARKGTPFCEECEKAPLSKRSISLPMPVAGGGGAPAARSAEVQAVLRSPATSPAEVPPSQGGLSPNVDPAEFARVMRQASAEGQPFCEECERARLKQASSQPQG